MENNKRDSSQSAIFAGKKLKEAREKKSLTIEQVQKQTKIHSSVLIGLEEGRVSELLTDTYVRSFLKKYAQFIGVNSVELLKDYFPARDESPAINTVIKESPSFKRPGISPKLIYAAGLAIGAIVLIALLIFVFGKISTALNRPRAVAHKTAPAQVKKKPTQNIKKAPKSKTASKTKSVTKELVPKSAPLNLQIRVKETVLVKLERDGLLLYENVLVKGLDERIIADNSIEINTAKMRSLELTLNGKIIALPNDKVISGIEITRKGIRFK